MLCVGLQYNLFLTGIWKLKRMITNDEVMKDHISNLNIKPNFKILDFGCGDGLYTILFARLLGRKGKIFAIDSDATKLKKLKEKVKEEKLDNKIQVIQAKEELTIPLDGECIDVTLLYNVACCIHGKDNQEDLVRLVEDIYRITKESGRLVINIKGKKIDKRIDNTIPEIEKYFKLEKKEMKKYFLENERVRHRFFYYLTKAQ